MINKIMAHQKYSIKKLSKYQCGAIFNEMGTGKTRIYLELAKKRIEEGKALYAIILCPVSTKSNISFEIKKHLNEQSTIFKNDYNQSISTYNIIGIESISSCQRAILKLKELCIEKSVLIIDESHLIKNSSALRTKRILKYAIACKYKYISTGTPMPNGIEDLWTQINFLSTLILNPFYRNYRDFSKRHLGINYYNKIKYRYHTDEFIEIIKPYTVCFKKSDCLDLPSKIYNFYTCEFSKEQFEFYEFTKRKILLNVNPFDIQNNTIYKLFTALQQITSGIIPYWAFDDDEIKYFDLSKIVNPKIDLLDNLLPKIKEKIIIWCKYKKEIEQVNDFCKKNNLNSLNIFGKIHLKEREKNINLFKNEHDINILVATTAVGGIGLDLSFCQKAIYISNSFSYSTRIQSEDRLHRIGLKKSAHYIDFFVNIGIEKKIQRSLNRKSNAMKDFIDKIKTLKIDKTDKNRNLIMKEINNL